jgi:hypothetical protein
VTLALGLSAGTLVACSGTPGPPPAAAPQPSTEATPALRVPTRVTRVAGELAPRRRRTVAVRTARVVSAFAEAAFLGDYPRRDFDNAFPGFTSGARALAAKDRAVLTGRRFARADDVAVTRSAAYVAVAAPTGRPVGATVRLSLDLDVVSDEVTTPVQVRGRLLLTPSGQGWRIFGYDLSRSDTGSTATGRS